MHSTLLKHRHISKGSTQVPPLYRGNHFGTKQEVLPKRIALHDTLVAANEDLSMLGTLRAASLSLNPNSMIDVGYEEAEGRKCCVDFSCTPDPTTTPLTACIRV